MDGPAPLAGSRALHPSRRADGPHPREAAAGASRAAGGRWWAGSRVSPGDGRLPGTRVVGAGAEDVPRLYLEQFWFGDVGEVDIAGEDLAVAELAENLEHLGPGGVHALVDLLVHLDG